MPVDIDIQGGGGTAPSSGGLGDLVSWANPIGAVASGLFNAWSSRKQQKFQEKMANTQYQRAAKDLEAAGLNRVLALGGGASAPAGTASTLPNIGESYQSGQTAKQQIATGKASESATDQASKDAMRQAMLGRGILYQQNLQQEEITKQERSNTALLQAEQGKQTKLKAFYDTLTPEEAALFEAANATGSAAGALVPIGKAVSNTIEGGYNSAKKIFQMQKSHRARQIHGDLDNRITPTFKDPKK